MKRYTQADSRDGWYEIQPGEAQALLDGGFRNRPLRENHAQAIAADMSAGHFMPNGEPLIMDGKGVLLDGQHRCRAAVIANRPFRSYVIHGAKPAYFATFDSVARVRSGGDLAALLGHNHYNTAAGIARWAIRYELGGSTGAMAASFKIPNWHVEDFLKKRGEDVRSAIEETKKYEKHLRNKLYGQVVFVYFMARATHPEKALGFVVALAEGADLPSGSPVLAFRNRFFRELNPTVYPVKTWYRLGLLVKAWRAFRDGKKVSVLKLVEGESFPRFDVGE